MHAELCNFHCCCEFSIQSTDINLYVNVIDLEIIFFWCYRPGTKQHLDTQKIPDRLKSVWSKCIPKISKEVWELLEAKVE